MRKRLIIIFIIGFLIMGIGSGIAFAEFSSFRYGGEKSLGREMDTVKLLQQVPEGTEEVIIHSIGYYRNRIQIVEDSSLEKNEMIVEVTCDTHIIEPVIEETKELDEEESSDENPEYVIDEGGTGEAEENMPDEGMTEGTDETLEETEPEKAPSPQKAVYTLNYYYYNSYDDLSEFFKMKDELMECIKTRVVYSYPYEEVEKVVIKASPELAGRIILR